MVIFSDNFIALNDSGTVLISGDWTIRNITKIKKQVESLIIAPKAALQTNIAQIDTAGAMLLNDLMARIGQSGLSGLEPQQESLLKLVAQTSNNPPPTPPVQTDMITAGLTAVGKSSVTAWEGFIEFVRFVGETSATLIGSLMDVTRIRLTSIVRHIKETGLSAIPIVALIAFLISIVLAYQGANELRRFGAEIFTIDMVAISVLREMGVLLTAIMVAGRSGSAFTAEIGMMKVNEEIDAMRLIGINPFEVLVLPRLIALMITLPILTFIADLMALAGGGIISYSLINVGFDQYVERVHSAAGLNDFMVGMIKAPVFAFFIVIVGCLRGMQVKGSAEDIGRQTTASVVQSIFLVLLLDALFSVLFTKMGV